MKSKFKTILAFALVCILLCPIFLITSLKAGATEETTAQKIDLSSATATADSKHTNPNVGQPSAVIDGDTSTNISTSWISTTATNGEYTPHYLQLDLENSITLNKIVLVPRLESNVPTYFPKDFSIEVSYDGTIWTSVLNVTDYTAESTTGEEFIFKSETGVKGIRISVTRNTPYNSNYYGFGLTELEAYYDPTCIITKIDISGATATADSKHTNPNVGQPSAVIDGDTSTNISTSWISTTATNGEYTPHYLQLDLENSITLNKIVMVPRLESNVPTYFPKDFSIEVSYDGTNWATVVQKTNYTAESTTGEEFRFRTETGVKGIRISVTRNTPYNSKYYGFGLTELEAHYDPTPASIKLDLVGATATADSKHTNQYVGQPSAVIDGDTSTNISTSWISTTATNGEYTPHYLQLDLAVSAHFNRIVMVPRLENNVPTYFPRDFIIEVSYDGVNWSTIVQKTDYTAESTTGEEFTFNTETNVKSIRISVTRNTPYNSKYYGFGLTELEIYYDEAADSQSSDKPLNNLNIISAEASSSHTLHPTANLIDGNLNNIWSNDDPSNRPDPSANTELILELEKLSYISGLYLYPTIISDATPDVNFPSNFAIYLSKDGESYGEPVFRATSYTITDGALREWIDFGSVIGDIKYIKLDIAPGDNESGYVHFAEIEALGAYSTNIDGYAENLIITEPSYGDAKITFENLDALYKNEIIASSNEEIINLYGQITYPQSTTTVTLTIKITNTINTNETRTITKDVTVKTMNILKTEIAAKELTLIYAPGNVDTYITLPTVEGHTVTIAASDNEDIISLDGKITRPASTTGVKLTLMLTNNESGDIAYTNPLLVPIYKAYTKPSMTAEEIEKIHEEYEDNAYGAFIHYVSEYRITGTVYPDGTVVKTVDELADAFDAEAFAKSMSDIGVEYVVFTAWHGDARTLFPSMTNQRWRDDRRTEDTTGAKSYSDRDLIADLIAALSAYDIDLHLYTHPADGGPDFTEEDKLLTGWDDATDNYAVWNQYVNELYYELCERYGDAIKGLWFDGAYNHVPGADAQNRLRETCTSFNPAMILTANLAFQEGTVYENPVYDGSDYLCWEVPEGYNFLTDRKISRHQTARVIAGAGWWTKLPSTQTPANLPTAEEMFKYLVALSSVSEQGGFLASTGFYPVREGEVIDDYFMAGIGDALRKLNSSYLTPLKSTIYNTNNSTAYPTAENISVSELAWGVANESKDGKEIYLHVLNAPDGNTLVLPKTSDGTFFKRNAVIMNYDGTETPVTILKTDDGYSITLPDGVEWNEVDTVIKAERMSFDFIPKGSITLGDELVYNVYVPAVDYLNSFTIDGQSYENLKTVILEDEEYYRISVPLSAAEAARTIILNVTITIDENNYIGSWTMSILKYARSIIDANESEEEITLVKDVLAYIRAAYVYSGAEGIDEALAAIDEIISDYNKEFERVDGAADIENGLKGVIFVLNTKPCVRFILPEGKTADNYTFTSADRTLSYTTGVYNDGEKDYVYVEFKLYAYQLVNEICYTDGEHSGCYHLNAYYDFVTTDKAHKDDANLIALVEKLYNYCKSAEAYKASVTN